MLCYFDVVFSGYQPH